MSTVPTLTPTRADDAPAPGVGQPAADDDADAGRAST